ncbi:MAG TPA: hypothetical protein VMB47_03345 [Candidatus Aquilonibacter sp.]|nr:hypothetical protein [Candidatus Aquilonibacter sp.]
MDSLGVQGYWVCAILAVITIVTGIFSGHAIALGITGLLFWIGGVGVREHSLYAAATVFATYAVGVVQRPSALGFLIAALLLSNLRATWIASQWKPNSNEGIAPPRLGETWGDKFSDQVPLWLWPKVRIVYYVSSACFLALTAVGLVVLFLRGASVRPY